MLSMHISDQWGSHFKKQKSDKVLLNCSKSRIWGIQVQIPKWNIYYYLLLKWVFVGKNIKLSIILQSDAISAACVFRKLVLSIATNKFAGKKYVFAPCV